MPPTPNQRRGYRVQKTDNALTLPGRSTFPQGSYVTSYGVQTKPPSITPYQMNTGTQASGLSGGQGSSAAMYPANQAYPTYSMNPKPKTPTGFGVPAQIQGGFSQAPKTPNNTYAPLGVPYNQLPRPGFSALPQLQSAVTAQQAAANVPQTVPTGGAAPFGYNAFGERLDSQGNVWNPATAKTDIYGGRFIQPGDTRWERINGKLQKVQYGKNGQKKVLRFRDIVGNAEAQRLDSLGRDSSNAGRNVSSQFVSFRS